MDVACVNSPLGTLLTATGASCGIPALGSAASLPLLAPGRLLAEIYVEHTVLLCQAGRPPAGTPHANGVTTTPCIVTITDQRLRLAIPHAQETFHAKPRSHSVQTVRTDPRQLSGAPDKMQATAELTITNREYFQNDRRGAATGIRYWKK